MPDSEKKKPRAPRAKKEQPIIAARVAIRVDGIVDFTAEVTAREIDWSAYAPLNLLRVTASALAEIARLNREWWIGNGGRRADLRGADLRGAYLRGAYLQGADLRGADLRGADLQGADLRGADLQGADLQGADLRGAYLRGAYLQGADLQGADLQGADLQGADLQGADLRGAYLQGADLRGAYLRGADLRGAYLRGADLPSPTVILLAAWGALSAPLTVELMRYDAANHPDPTAFDRWAGGGACPYSDVKVERAALFTENRDLWTPGPCPRPHDLMVAVLAEKCPDWTEEQRVAFEAVFTARREAVEKAQKERK